MHCADDPSSILRGRCFGAGHVAWCMCAVGESGRFDRHEPLRDAAGDRAPRARAHSLVQAGQSSVLLFGRMQPDLGSSRVRRARLVELGQFGGQAYRSSGGFSGRARGTRGRWRLLPGARRTPHAASRGRARAATGLTRVPVSRIRLSLEAPRGRGPVRAERGPRLG